MPALYKTPAIVFIYDFLLKSKLFHIVFGKIPHISHESLGNAVTHAPMGRP